jgi:hypothetical protein
VSRGRANVSGRTAAVPVVTFRVSVAERAALQAAATAAGVSVNELARRRSLGLALCSMSATSTGPDSQDATSAVLHRAGLLGEGAAS